MTISLGRSASWLPDRRTFRAARREEEMTIKTILASAIANFQARIAVIRWRRRTLRALERRRRG